jgi:hypothetical protein
MVRRATERVRLSAQHVGTTRHRTSQFLLWVILGNTLTEHMISGVASKAAMLKAA